MADSLQVLRRMYDNASQHYTLPDFDTFCKDMQDEKKRKAAYDALSGTYDLPDYATFTKDVTITTTTPQPQQQSTPTTVKPVTDTTAQQASVTSASQPAPAQGWKPSAAQQMEFNRQMDEMQAERQQQRQQFEQRMEGIKKGNRPGAFMGEREFNLQTGKMDPRYYSTQGERVGTQMEQSHKNTEYHHWWEDNTEAGQRSKEQRLQREDERRQQVFDSSLASLWSRHNPQDGLNAAEQAWSVAEERQMSVRNRNAKKHWDSYAAMGGGREMRVVTTSMNRHDDAVGRLTNFDLDRLMNDAWENLGEDGQQALIDDCHQMLRYRNPGTDDLTLYQQAKELARQQSDLRLYNLAVEKNLPQNNLEYLMRKIGDANLLNSISKGLAVSSAGTTGDMAAYEAANEQYRQDGHKIIDVVGTVSGMALDPTMWISGGVGSAATKGAMWAGGRRLAGRGATAAVTNAATRQFATSMTGRVVGGVVGGAANFGTFEGIKEMENQFAHGGHIVGTDEVGRYINEGYSAIAVGGQALHGLGMGAAIGWLTPVSGNVADKLVRGTSSTIGKVAGRAGMYAGATTLEGTIFSIPEWMDGNRDGFDVWTDNMAMMVGFKAKHMIKTAGGVLGDLQKSFESPANGRKNRLDFESRLRQRMDAPSDGGLALTKDEDAELKRYGYDLHELVESTEKTGNAAEGSLIAENAPEIVSRLTDMVYDPRISEAARAKMYYYATGRKLPESTIMRGEMYEDGNGGFVVESQGANGVITSRTFTSRKAADLELERINRQTELNHIEIGERYQQTVDFENRLQEACRTVAEANGWNAVEVYRTCEEARRNHLRSGDKQFDEAQQNILRKVTEAMGEFSETGVTDAMRGSINEKYGVDIDAAIRKEANRRTQAEQTAIDEYLGELIPRRAKDHAVEDAEAEDITNQKRLTDEPEPPANEFGEGDPIDPRFDGGEPTPDYDPHQPNGEQKPIGRAVMKYQDRQVEVLSGRVTLTDDGTMIDNERSDNSIVVRDIATGKVEMVSPEAMLSYEEYAPEPVVPDTEQPIDQQPEGAEPTEQSKYTSGQIKIRNSDGSETRGVLTGYVDEEGKHEYYVEGDLQHLHYATESELDNILSDYLPDAPQEPVVPKDSQGNDIAVGDEVVLSAGRTGVVSGIKPDGSVAVDHNGETVTYNEQFGDITATGLRKVVQTPPVEEAPAAPTEAPTDPINPTPEPTPVPAQMTEGAVLPNGITAVGSINVPQRDGSTRTFTIGKNAEGENVVLDESGFLWGHDGTGANMQPHRPGSNVPIWTDEQITQFGAVKTTNEQTTTVPITPETVPNPVGNAAPVVENVPEAVQAELANALAEVEAQRNVFPEEDGKDFKDFKAVNESRESGIGSGELGALSQVPVDESGRLRYEDAEPDVAWDAIVEQSDGDEAIAAEVVADIVAEHDKALKAAEKALKKIREGKPEAGKAAVSPTVADRIAAKRAAKMAVESAEKDVAEAAARLEKWQNIASTTQRRKDAAEALEREAAEAARREQQEWEQAKQRLDARVRDTAERYRDVPEVLEILGQQDPVSIDEVAAWVLSRHKVLWGNRRNGDTGNIVRAGAAYHAGIGEGERRKLMGLFAAEKNGGMSIERLAEDVFEQACDQFGVPYDNQQALDALIDVIKSAGTRGDITGYITNKRIAQAEKEGAAVERMHEEAEASDREFMERHGMTEAEWIEFYSAHGPEIELSDEDFRELIANLDVLKADEEYGRREIQESAAYPAGGAGTETVHTDSGGMVSEGGLHDHGTVEVSESRGGEKGGGDVPLRHDEGGGENPPRLDTGASVAATAPVVTEPTEAQKKAGNNNVANGGADVALLNQVGQGGELRGNEPPASGEQTPAGTEPSDRGAGVAGYSAAAGSQAIPRSGAEGIREIQRPLTESEADEMLSRMETKAEQAKEIELTPENWFAMFGARGVVKTPIGEVKMGENQLGKLILKKRTEYFGMIYPTLTDPDVIIEKAAPAEGVERDTKYLFVRTFTKPDGSRIVHFESITVQKDGMEVSISSHEAESKSIKKEMQNGKILHLSKKLSLDSDGYLTEAPNVPEGPDLVPTSDNNIVEPEKSIDKRTDTDENPKDLRGDTALSQNSNASDRKDTQSLTEEQISSSTSSEAASPMTVQPSVQTSVQAASAEVNLNPTPAQADAGNYKKGHVTIGDFDITIENPAGSIRKGVDAEGKSWETTMANAYGYIKGTESVDGDPIDVFLHTDMDEWNGRKVYVVDQTRPNGSFDEHKVMLGFNDKDAAMSAYLANYDETWAQTHSGLRISETNLEDFDKWIKSSHRKTKPFADYSNVSKVTDNAPTELHKAEGYTIEARKDTRDNSDIYAVKFEERVGRDEFKGQKAIAKKHGGYWSNFGKKGFLFKSEADAKAFAAEVMGKSEDDIADEAPLSMADISEESPKPDDGDRLIGWDESGPEENPFLNVGADKPTEMSTPKKRSKWISDEDAAEFDNLRSGLRSHLGTDTPDIVREDIPSYGHKKSQTRNRQDLTTPPAKAEVTSSSLKGLAKLQKVAEKLAVLKKKIDGKTSHRGVISELASAVMADSQGYSTIVTANGNEVHIRISNHNANAEHFERRGHNDDNVSIVIKSRRTANTFRPHQEVELTEYVYTTEAIKTDSNILSQVAESLRQMIETGEYVDLSGKALVNRSPETDIVMEDTPSYGKPQPKQMDAEVLRMGTRMTYLMMKGGLRKFSEYAEAMVDEVGDAIRPHLKSLYAAAQNMEEVMQLGWDEEMDDRKTVKSFDVYNFDKPGAKDIIETAQHIVDEQQSQRQTQQLIDTLKDKRNEQREKEADETSADTEIVVDKAEATASKVESELQGAKSEEDAERLNTELDKEIEEVNKQLALLGYYEADLVEKDFNEAYGYMRNAERKATQDAHRLAMQLAADLGLSLPDPKGKVKKSKPYGFGSKVAKSNIAPAGGEVSITLPLAEDKELSVVLFMEPNAEWLENGKADGKRDDLVFNGGYFRVENPNGKGFNGRYLTSNNDINADATYDELLADVRRAVRHLLPNEEVRPSAPLTPQPGEDMVKMAERVAKDNEPKKPTIQPEQTMGDLFGGLFDTVEPETPQQTTTSKPKENEKTNVQPRTEETGRGRQQPRPNEPLGESAEHEDERTDGGRVAQRSGEHSVSDAKRSGSVSRPHQGDRGVEQPKNTRNNHAERGMDYAPKGEKARIDANIAAIELAKRLLDTGATATPKEMEVLRRYSGWGGLGAAFNEGERWSPNPINKRLRELLTPEEYEAAVMSRNSAYYTPAPVIDAMWDIARALGFRGGNMVEGSAGIGNIIGLMPTDLSQRSNIHAVEIDKTTGGILSLLYPDAKVEVQGFEQTRIPNGSVDLAITNVPFVTGLHVMDESGDSDLSKKFRDIHDFCIAKNVRKLREGGIGIFITSSGTLDKSQKLRNWLVGDKDGNVDVVGVFRMHNQTFGGTAATSDIIVLRKRVNGRKSANAIDVSTVSVVRTATYENEKGKTKDLPLLINRYYIEHPEYMGGEMFFGFEQGDTFRPTSMGLFPMRNADQAERIAAWVKGLSAMDWRTEAVSHKTEESAHINEALGENVKEGSMVLDSDNNLCVARMGRAVPLDINTNKIKGRTKQECFSDYSELKNALDEVLKYQTEHDDDAGLQSLLDRLNTAYDSFVEKYGNLNRNVGLAWLRNNDIDYPSIAALETISERGSKDGKKVVSFGKTDIFNRRVVDKESEPAPKNVKDGIIASLYKFGRIDPAYLSEQLGKSDAEVKQEIIESGLGFEDPTTGQMEVSYEYLSGNVREKLRQAKEANESNPGAYDVNIKALEAVVPMNIPAHLIVFTLGSSWVDPKLYERFVKERTELDVTLTNAGGTWHMSEPWNTDRSKNMEMGVRSETLGVFIPGHKLIEAAITNKTITVSKTYRNYDGSTETKTDPAATTACAVKVDEIRQDFKDWARELMQQDPEMSMRMEEIYNEQFNNSVPKSIPDEFIPEHFGGAATMVGGKPFHLRPHQAKAVIRATTQPVLLAHEVGTGKTYTLITTAMEMRRLGTARKPMIVVQNATVGQFVASAKALYPNAKVLTLEDADRNAEGRRAFYAKIKFNDWDMIVVPQSVFERIPDSVERQTKFIQDKIEEKMLVLEQMKEADPDGKSMIVRQAEKEIERLNDEIVQIVGGETPVPKSGKKKDAKKAAVTRQNAEVKAREMLDRETDDVEDFDSMGIDAILVDEAHEYKHLGFATAMQRGVKGVDPSYSKKSQGVFLKAQAVLEKTGGKNVVFATGTPISNTAAEIWTFMRYLMPADVMKDYGIYYFDDFVRNFGNLQQMLEFSTSGKYKENNRFAGYVNLPELVRIWSTVADTVLTREAGGVSDKIPQMEGDKAQDIFLPQTRALRAIMKYVKAELDAYDKMSGKEKKENSHVPLVMYGIAKAAAVDARLVQADAEDDPNSKTNEAVRQTMRSLEDTKDYKGTVAIFADNYQNKATGFNLYEDIREKLIAQGVPAEQIVVMKSGMSVKKKVEIFDKVNSGEVRVIMGSTFTLGTGVNIQERLHTLIHLDAPNRPMDYTQRNGRILRQGNLHRDWNLPVRVLRFGVEDSLDVTAYQRLKTKGAIADSIMNGKSLMENSMESRSLEEEQDLFGDITAQLSGSEYALLKNQIEKEVRKLTAKLKAWEADQTYIHNRKRQIAGQNKDAEKRVSENKTYLDKVEGTSVENITVGKLSFPSVGAMENFFSEQNKQKRELEEQVRKQGYTSRPATMDITVSIEGFAFKIHTDISQEMKSGQGTLFASASSKMTYSCPELGIDAAPVKGNLIKNAVSEIMEDVISGKDFRERIEAAERAIERNNAELKSMEARDGVPFQHSDELAQAEAKLEEYEGLMKKEMEEKEAKYVDLDKEVKAATGVEYTAEDAGEDSASEPAIPYNSTENVNFAYKYETQSGKTINYTSENSEAYGGLFDFDFSAETEAGHGMRDTAGAGVLQLERNPDRSEPGSGLDRASGEFAAVERVFKETGSFNFMSGERIESADDVAFIFSALEDKAKEHAFVALVKDGRPTVVELGMGTLSQTLVDSPTFSLAYSRIRPDEVYFVHNHPSGNLKCSPQDAQMLKKFEDMCDVPVHGVIINLKTGHYGTFDTSGGYGIGSKRTPESASPLTVHTLDKQIFAADYDPMMQPQVRSSQDVAAFLNSHRMGDRSKVSFLILSRANKIVGNIHTPYTGIPADADELARYISERVIQFGGESAILYGDFAIDHSECGAYNKLKQSLQRVGDTRLLDVVTVEGNHTKSANEEGMLFEPGSEYGASAKSDIRFREVEDDKVLTEFAEGKTVKAYRTMQVIDGKLYSPMATKVGGKTTPEIKLGVPEQSEEHPEIIKGTKIGKDGVEQGYVVIDKGLGKGTLTVAYNPYAHTSRTVLNDQFSSAYIRPNLVTVEVEVPESELTSGYRARMAKDAVGEISWHSGSVSGQLAELGKPRRVILTRYDKPVRIVPFKEVAEMIAAQLDGTDIAIPYNVVQPQLRAELERLGVAISEEASGSVSDVQEFGKAEYITDQEIERINAHQQEMAQTAPEAKSGHAEKLSKKFNTPIRIVEDPTELTHDDPEMQKHMSGSKGFYNPVTGEVVVVVPNNVTVEDVAETVFHEVVAHKGLREIIGEENYDAFCDEVYDHLKDDLKQQIDEETTHRFVNEPGKGYEHHRRVAVDEMFGRMSEKGFEDFTKAERGIWAKLKAKVLEAINKFLGSLKLPKWVKLGDNELRYMLWRSHERLTKKSNYVDMARDAAKRRELGLDDGALMRDGREVQELRRVNDRFNEQLEKLSNGVERNGELKLGKPGAVLRSAGIDGSGIFLQWNVLQKKMNPSYVHNHPFTIDDIKDLPLAINHPIAVFESHGHGDFNILVGLQKDGKNFVVSLQAKRKSVKGGEIEVDDIVTLYPKEEKGIIYWINNGLAKVFDKGKALEWLRTCETHNRHSAVQELEDATKVVKNFENPTIKTPESDLRFRASETGDIWNDHSVGLEERITNAAIRLANNQAADLTLRNDAMRAVTNNLQSLLHSMRNRRGTTQSFAGADRKVEVGVVDAMNAQAMYDRSTVKRVADLARILMQHGYLSGMTSGEMQRLLSAVKNATAMHDTAEYVQKIMDIMADNQLRNGEATLRNLLAIRGSKVDARGVEVQGALDVEGQRTMEVVKKAMSLKEDDINDRIAEALNRMSDPAQTIADQAVIEYAGLNMALDYVQNIANSKAEEKTLRDSLKTAKEDRDAGRMTDAAYKQYVETTEDAIRKNKIERAEAYFNLVGRLSDSLRGSIENAKAFREAEKARVNEIHHNANSDMEGRPTNEHHRDDWKDKVANNGFVQFLFSPLATFDQVMRVFGNKSANGEGYLWNRFMRGWVVARNKELTGVKEKFAQLDEKAAELFGKGKTWGDIIRMESKLPKATVSFWDGGEMRDHELTQGNLLYIYMVDKMTDGRMKLRRMGITEQDITNIENFLDLRFKTLGDWLQDEFLVATRNEYNETHKRMFGASMAAIENYFPLKILANARIDKEEDVNQPNRPDGITTKTGSIIKRRVNNLALDISGADALSVILDHITQMEHWNAYTEWNRDLNTLRTYKRFRNQVINMTTV